MNWLRRLFGGELRIQSVPERRPLGNTAGHERPSAPSRTQPLSQEGKRSKDLNVALLKAASAGNAEEARSLLASGADANTRGDFDVTPLMGASREGSVETVEVLLDAGANVNARANAGGTALLWAVELGHIEVVELLLGRGADPNVKENETGRSALMWAQEKGQHEIAALLERRGAAHPQSADGRGSGQESLAIRRDLFSGIPIRQISFRDSLVERAGNVAAAASMDVRHYFITGYPDTPADGAALFSTFEGATCLFALGEYGDQAFETASQAVRDRAAAIRVKTHCYPTYPILQFIVWIHSSAFFRETVADVRDGNIMDFVSDLCASRRWKLVFCRYDPSGEKRGGGLVDPVSATLKIRSATAHIIKREVRKARDAYLRIPSEKLDFAAASQRFMADNVPIGEMPKN